MDWRIKLLGQKAIDLFLPTEFGRRIHYRFQAKFGKVADWNRERRHREVQRVVAMAQYLHDQIAFKFDGAAILELGTGWHGTDVILFHLLGAREVWTCDVLRHLDERLFLKQVEAFGGSLAEIAARCDADLHEIATRYERLREFVTLEEMLRACHVTYKAPCRFDRLALPSSRFDLFYSYSTLQRVPPLDLRNYLRVAKDAVRAGGCSLHCIHHMDHNARHHEALRPMNYLSYSDWLYDLLQSQNFNYQNRMRHAEFLELFEQCGFTFECEELTLEPEQALSRVRLAKRFRRLPIDDVRVSRTQLLSTVPSQ